MWCGTLNLNKDGCLYLRKWNLIKKKFKLKDILLEETKNSAENRHPKKQKKRKRSKKQTNKQNKTKNKTKQKKQNQKINNQTKNKITNKKIRTNHIKFNFFFDNIMLLRRRKIGKNLVENMFVENVPDETGSNPGRTHIPTVDWKVHRLTKILFWNVLKWGLFFNVVPILMF